MASLGDKRFLQQVGDRVRQLRAARGLTQAELAAVSGLHRTFVGSVERGERNVALLTLRAIARGLRVGVADLLADPNPGRG